MRRILMVVSSALLIGWSALPSTAETRLVCGPRGDVVAGLKQKYAEEPVSMGLASNGTVIEVFASEAGTWTILMTHPNGLSCLLTAGENWENLSAKVAGAGI